MKKKKNSTDSIKTSADEDENKINKQEHFYTIGIIQWYFTTPSLNDNNGNIGVLLTFQKATYRQTANQVQTAIIK